MSAPVIAWGCVHGRFQPFHDGHLEYTLRAKERCECLVVGITNSDPTWIRSEPGSPHRHLAESNPFTYLERAAMVRDALLDTGLSPGEFLIVPFPIQDLELLPYYVPQDARHFVRVYSGWEQEKVRRLRSQDLSLEILDPGKGKGVSGEEVRRRLRKDGQWECLVPESTARLVRGILANDPQRLRTP